jgi:predicted FMN-binding regulatory protein PaiB
VCFSQGQQETPHDFLYRALSLRQKILFASQGKPDAAFDPNLLQRQFRQSVCTWLRDSFVRVELEPILNSYKDDDELIVVLNEITQRHTESEEKQGGKVQKVKAVVVETSLRDELRARRLEFQELKGATVNASPSVSAVTSSTKTAVSNRGQKAGPGFLQELCCCW